MKTTLIAITTIVLFSTSCTRREEAAAAATVSESAAKPYSLEICLVSGEKLGEMGDPVVIHHEGQEIKFCCDSCVPKFRKNPANYLPKLNPHPDA